MDTKHQMDSSFMELNLGGIIMVYPRALMPVDILKRYERPLYTMLRAFGYRWTEQCPEYHLFFRNEDNPDREIAFLLYAGTVEMKDAPEEIVQVLKDGLVRIMGNLGASRYFQ